MTSPDQATLFSQLAAMPGFLEATFGGLSPVNARTGGPAGCFSPVEQCWHLADLERDGYASRIRRLLAEVEPTLADFDGDRVAEERRYKTLSLAAGIQSFREARLANLSVLRSIAPESWSRWGSQEGVGVVTLCDLPAMMAQHDASHRHEIEAWMRTQRRSGDFA
jgi:hypothetical protein